MMNDIQRRILAEAAKYGGANISVPEQMARAINQVTETNNPNLPPITAADIEKMMRVWNRIMAKARKQFPNASEEEYFRISQRAMNYALGIKKEEVEVTEAKRQKRQKRQPEAIYFDSYTAALNAARAKAEKRGYTIDEDDWNAKVTHGFPGRPDEGNTTNIRIHLLKDGKPAKPMLIISVYGRQTSLMKNSFELTSYVSESVEGGAVEEGREWNIKYGTSIKDVMDEMGKSGWKPVGKVGSGNFSGSIPFSKGNSKAHLVVKSGNPEKWVYESIESGELSEARWKAWAVRGVWKKLGPEFDTEMEAEKFIMSKGFKKIRLGDDGEIGYAKGKTLAHIETDTLMGHQVMVKESIEESVSMPRDQRIARVKQNQAKIDRIKAYIEAKGLPLELQDTVGKRLPYLSSDNQRLGTDEWLKQGATAWINQEGLYVGREIDRIFNVLKYHGIVIPHVAYRNNSWVLESAEVVCEGSEWRSVAFGSIKQYDTVKVEPRNPDNFGGHEFTGSVERVKSGSLFVRDAEDESGHTRAGLTEFKSGEIRSVKVLGQKRSPSIRTSMPPSLQSLARKEEVEIEESTPNPYDQRVNKAKEIAKQIKDEAKARGVTVYASGDDVITATKEFPKGDLQAFMKAYRDCDMTLTHMRFTSRSNQWGCESAGFGVGAQECVKSGRVTINRSGGGGQLILKALQGKLGMIY